MTPGCTVELTDHMPLFTGAGLRAGSQWTVQQVHADRGTVNLADRYGSIVACCVPLGRVREVIVQLVRDEDF